MLRREKVNRYVCPFVHHLWEGLGPVPISTLVAAVLQREDIWLLTRPPAPPCGLSLIRSYCHGRKEARQRGQRGSRGLG